MAAERNPITDPQSGDRIPRTIYIYERVGKRLWISRKQFGAAERWINIGTLAKMAQAQPEEASNAER